MSTVMNLVVLSLAFATSQATVRGDARTGLASFVATCDNTSVSEYTDASGTTQTCDDGMICGCTNLFSSDNLWHCSDTDSVCITPQDEPLFPDSYDGAFVSVDVGIINTFGGGVNIWNTSGFFVHDTANKKERYDASSHLRSLSSGAYYQRRTDTSVTVDGTTYKVDTDGKCTTSDAAAHQFPGSATAGSVGRWAVDSYGFTSYADRYMGYEDDTKAVQVWGWTSYGGVGAYKLAEHRAYVDVATGVLLREHQVEQAMSYPTTVEVVLGAPEDVYTSFETIEGQSPMSGVTFFKVPDECA
mmetsp:Transcript_48309/g.135295  ORF Transcript_48309/g.135295 Transcript_48309/m.135295 type:complete len:300 (+) Transcript_48309:140-1039(+)|eukprot:CAMPEP_0119537614 /NCGR_PEP_ID=MMETSP1344-20130328/50238_1 /TAXON_ID=236787 /ORGANISM="Florenciella parvula, Strain CCMP2471" /LENGTH=299 /DNA_ID=CAMNT_0007580181 /DNA_START=115 /DNA_END=1014 /DNA_ORIENTATION=-